MVDDDEDDAAVGVTSVVRGRTFGTCAVPFVFSREKLFSPGVGEFDERKVCADARGGWSEIGRLRKGHEE